MHSRSTCRETTAFDINGVMAVTAEKDIGESCLHIAWQLLVNMQSTGQAQAEGLSLQCLHSEVTLA